MLQNRVSRLVFAVFALLVLAGLPAQAQPSRRAASGTRTVAAFGETTLARLWSRVASLWSLTKEGTSIDPDGSRATLPVSGGDDEGTSIDPNGHQ